MSNIPFNTVASILVTQNLQREVAAPKDKEFHDQESIREAREARSRRHAEQVEGAAELGVDHVGDQQNNAAGEDQREMPRRQMEERVEIEGVEKAPRPEARVGDNTPTNHLDISA